jgi:hypothetical protein
MLSLTDNHRPEQTGRSALKLVMTLLVRNEADIIEANLDYHLAQGVDFVIVTDHGSTDGTDELLRPYVREGVVTVLRDDAEGHHQSRRVTAMAQLARTAYGADWIIHNDADEFWWPVSGSLRDVFAAIPPQFGQIEVRRVNFLPPADPDSDGPFYSTMVHREARSYNLFDDPLEPKRAHRSHPDVVVAPGNHSVSGGDLRPSPISDMLEIFHFPMRGYEQFERKVIQTGTGYELVDDRSPGIGRDQLKLLAMYRDGVLRSFYEDSSLDEDALQKRIAEGSVVVDRRLKAFMADLAVGREPACHAASQAVTALLAGALQDTLELERQLERTRALERQLEESREAECHAHERELAVHDHLMVAVAQLDQLRTSRLMRSTAFLRRLWYRMTNAKAVR